MDFNPLEIRRDVWRAAQVQLRCTNGMKQTDTSTLENSLLHGEGLEHLTQLQVFEPTVIPEEALFAEDFVTKCPIENLPCLRTLQATFIWMTSNLRDFPVRIFLSCSGQIIFDINIHL